MFCDGVEFEVCYAYPSWTLTFWDAFIGIVTMFELLTEFEKVAPLL
jgi:hypothetical protein